MRDSSEKETYDAYVGQIARGAGVSSAGQGIGRIMGYATQVALARMYGPAQLGFYALGVIFVQLANILAQFGMDNSVLRYVAHYRAEKDTSRVRGTILLALCIPFAVSLVLSGSLFLGSGLLAERVFDKPFLESIFRTFSLAIPFFTVMSMALWATQGFQTVKYATYVEHVLRPLINLVLVVTFYLLGVQILGAVAAYVLSMTAGSALALYYLYRIFPKLVSRETPAKFEARQLFNVSGPMLVANATAYVNAWAMIGLLGIFAPAREVGIYDAAARTAALSSLALIAFGGIFSPMVSALYRRNSLQHLGYLYQDVSRWVFTASLAIFLVTVFMGKEVLAVFGDQFVPGWPAMVVIAGAQLFGASVGLTGRVLAMTGRQKVVMRARLASAFTSLAAGVALIPLYGIIGAAVATAAGLVVANALTVLSVRRLLGVWPYSRQFLKPLVAGLLAVGGVLLARWALPLPEGFLAILVLAPMFMVLFVALIVALRLSESDRQFLRSFWTAVRRRATAVTGRGG